MNLNLSYQLQFNDGTTFEGQSLNGDWEKAPNKPVKRFVYNFNGKNIVLENFKQYHHLVERYVKVGGKTVIPQILLIGRKENESHLVIINFKKKKVYKEVVELGKEYNNMIITGWKDGI